MTPSDLEKSIDQLWSKVAVSSGFNKQYKQYITIEQLKKLCNSSKLLERILIVIKLKGNAIDTNKETKLRQIKDFTCH